MCLCMDDDQRMILRHPLHWRKIAGAPESLDLRRKEYIVTRIFLFDWT